MTTTTETRTGHDAPSTTEDRTMDKLEAGDVIASKITGTLYGVRSINADATATLVPYGLPSALVQATGLLSMDVTLASLATGSRLVERRVDRVDAMHDLFNAAQSAAK